MKSKAEYKESDSIPTTSLLEIAKDRELMIRAARRIGRSTHPDQIEDIASEATLQLIKRHQANPDLRVRHPRSATNFAVGDAMRILFGNLQNSYHSVEFATEAAIMELASYPAGQQVVLEAHEEVQEDLEVLEAVERFSRETPRQKLKRETLCQRLLSNLPDPYRLRSVNVSSH